MTMKKRNFMKKLGLLFLSICLLSGSLSMVGPGASISAQAASSTTKKIKSKVTTIVNNKTKKKDTKKQKLQKLFKYTEKTYGYKRAIFKNKKGWEKTYALEMYNKKKGSCYHFAAAYAFLAKKATNYKVRIAVGKTNGFNRKIYQPHSWVEVKIGSTWYICDPNMDKFAAKSSGKYFLKKRSALKKTYNNYKKVSYINVTI